ncbi:hypothetical protein J2Y55_004600 [Bosea sp. BE125]|uniref:hypothetical protein n=1 Tax=Bosea sp. BE125 TaxID=2817909 RepID=UPI00285432A2|nr:hypothetical protein [Bosea sp. BE125]MDR6873573.1 hypothetical protein [Bosea sp. BE125]
MSITDHTIQWQGMAVSICHVANWSGTGFDHIEVQTVTPERARLPITETGYRSHFLHGEDLAGHGGAVAFVTKWLDHEAKSAAWREYQRSSAQLPLF